MRLRSVFFFLALLAGTGGVHAQDAVRLDVRVEHVAGTNAYLGAGSDDGLATGDTLDVYREDVRLGQVYVVSATATRAVVAFVGEAFPLTRGTELTVERTRRAAPPPPPEPSTPVVPVDTARTSILDRPATPPPSTSARSGARFTGRLQVGTTALWSRTLPLDSEGDGTTRQFATPFLSLRGRVADLPGGLDVNLQGRVAYRYRSLGRFDEPTDLRLYRASVERRVAFVDVEVGRLYNEYDRYSGYLDGIRLHAGNNERGVGVTAGVEPDRANGLVSTDLPKVTVFGHYRMRPDPFRLDLTAVAGQILPQAEGLTTRTFAGASARASTDGLALSTDVLVDRDPDDGSPVLSRFLVRGSWSVLPRLRLRARYYHRRPYLLFGSTQRILDPSQRTGAGLSYTLGDGLFNGTVLRADLSRSERDDGASLTYSGGVFAPRLPGLGLGLNASGSVWTRDGQTSIYALAAFTRSFGRVYASLGYQFQQTPLLARSLTTHGVEGTLQLPLTDTVSATVQASAQAGETLQNARLYSGLWWRF